MSIETAGGYGPVKKQFMSLFYNPIHGSLSFALTIYIYIYKTCEK